MNTLSRSATLKVFSAMCTELAVINLVGAITSFSYPIVVLVQIGTCTILVITAVSLETWSTPSSY